MKSLTNTFYRSIGIITLISIVGVVILMQFTNVYINAYTWYIIAYHALLSFISYRLIVKGAEGDANLRSNMNWDELPYRQDILIHWQKLGQFRAKHIAVGAGVHEMITASPYYFYRSYEKGNYKDRVVIGIDVYKGVKSIDVSKVFKEGEILHDAYSGITAEVKKGKVIINSDYDIVLLEKI